MIFLRGIIFLLVFAYPFLLAAGDEGVSERDHIALPVSEVAYKITRWMVHTGLKPEQSEMVNGGIRIVATKGENNLDEIWLIEMSPLSPLGTDIYIQLQGKNSSQDQLKQLTEMYQIKENEQREVVTNSANVIPEPVLNQIANVACIHVRTRTRSIQFTGFFIDNDGLILSTAHDLLEHEHVSIISNTGIPYEGDVIKADFTKDLALIKVNAAKEDIVKITEGRNLLGMGEKIFLIGCPINLRGTIHQGFVNGPPRKVADVPLWQVQIKIEKGSSGSPVFDSSGAFVAVVKGRHREAKDIGFLIPLQVVVDFLKDYFSS